MSYSNPIEHLYNEEVYIATPKDLVIIPVPWDSLAEADQLLLSKILGSVKRSASSVQVLTVDGADTDELLIYCPSRIIAFGSPLTVSGKNVVPYQSLNHNQVLVLLADSLSQLDDAKKKNLWNALRDMFQV